MPGFMTDYTNDIVLSLLFGATAYTAPATLYVGLSLGFSNKTGTVTEPSGSSYARVSVTNNTTNFPAASGGATSNATAIAFPAPTGAWGTILSCFIADASSGGHVLAMADLATSVSPTSGWAAPTLHANALNFQHT